MKRNGKWKIVSNFHYDYSVNGINLASITLLTEIIDEDNCNQCGSSISSQSNILVPYLSVPHNPDLVKGKRYPNNLRLAKRETLKLLDQSLDDLGLTWKGA